MGYCCEDGTCCERNALDCQVLLPAFIKDRPDGKYGKQQTDTQAAGWTLILPEGSTHDKTLKMRQTDFQKVTKEYM